MGNNWLDSKVVGTLIRYERQKAGLTQETLSGLAGIGRAHLSAIERGARLPTLETVFRICYALQIDACELIREINKTITINTL